MALLHSRTLTHGTFTLTHAHTWHFYTHARSHIHARTQVSQKVAEGVKTAAQTAKQIEEDYKVSERASAAASSLYQQAIEYERANRIRERMYAGTV